MLSDKEIQALFPSFEKELVSVIAEKAELVSFKEGDFLMKTGQYIRSTVLIVDGLVKLFREDDEGNEFFMYYLQGGQACALSMICAAKSETSQILAKAETDVHAIALPIEYMDTLMKDYKTWYYFVLETYRNRFEELLVTIDNVAFRNMDERLVFYLKKQQEVLGTNTLSISNTEIAQELNSSREVISRLMKKLSERGVVKIERSHVELLNLNIF